MHIPAVPDKDPRMSYVAEQLGHEGQSILAGNSVFMNYETQVQCGPSWRYRGGGHDRKAVVAVPRHKDVSFTVRGPCPRHHGLQHKSAFINIDNHGYTTLSAGIWDGLNAPLSPFFVGLAPFRISRMAASQRQSTLSQCVSLLQQPQPLEVSIFLLLCNSYRSHVS